MEPANHRSWIGAGGQTIFRALLGLLLTIGSPHGAFAEVGLTQVAEMGEPVVADWPVLAAAKIPSTVRQSPALTLGPSLDPQVAQTVVVAHQPRVLSGIDVLVERHFAPLTGHRIGLVTNQTGRDANGRRTIDLLATAAGLQLLAIFTPEHGLNANRDGAVESARDETTGLPMYSLYGSTRRPTESTLAGLDTIVVDLQDAGVRFYTYPSTVGYVLEEAAKRDLAVYVLDRPDPLNAASVRRTFS